MDGTVEQASSSGQEARKLLNISHQDIFGGCPETLRTEPDRDTGLLTEDPGQLPDLQLFVRAETVRSELARILQ